MIRSQSRPDSPIMVAVPNVGKIHTSLVVKLLALSRNERYDLAFHFSRSAPVFNNMNKIVLAFLESDCSHLLTIDSDTVPLANPLDLIELDLDVAGMICPIWKANRDDGDNVVWNVVPLDDPQTMETQRGRLVEVETMGSAGLIITRRVLEHPAMRGPFADIWDEDGIRTIGGDLNFCYRLRAAGFKVWAALDYQCGHEHEVDLRRVGDIQHEEALWKLKT